MKTGHVILGLLGAGALGYAIYRARKNGTANLPIAEASLLTEPTEVTSKFAYDPPVEETVDETENLIELPVVEEKFAYDPPAYEEPEPVPVEPLPEKNISTLPLGPLVEPKFAYDPQPTKTTPPPDVLPPPEPVYTKPVEPAPVYTEPVRTDTEPVLYAPLPPPPPPEPVFTEPAKSEPVTLAPAPTPTTTTTKTTTTVITSPTKTASDGGAGTNDGLVFEKTTWGVKGLNGLELL